MKNILVIGSSNTDMVIQVENIPLPGQTVLGGEFSIFAGGKGANQAVAAKRAGAEVNFLASLGNDELGRSALSGFHKEGINTESIQCVDGLSSGVALIFVNGEGENCIGVASGANNALSVEYVEQNIQAFSEASHVLIQLEIPMTTVEKTAEICKKIQLPLIINPAPAATLSSDLLDGLYCLTPNETEAETLTGIEVKDIEGAKKAAMNLISQGVINVIVTLGGQGALICNKEEVTHLKAPVVKVVDTTGAGDTFNGILTTLLSEGKSIVEATKVAIKGASLSVQMQGATTSIPFRKDYI